MNYVYQSQCNTTNDNNTLYLRSNFMLVNIFFFPLPSPCDSLFAIICVHKHYHYYCSAYYNGDRDFDATCLRYVENSLGVRA
jgi:hypothetical protein